jgi:Ca-activated chloride channel family protein
MVVKRPPAAARAASFLLAVLFPCALVQAFQSPGQAIEITPREHTAAGAVPEAHLRADASMVLVPVQVATRSGAPLTGLTRDEFHIYEDGAEQHISYFARDDAPASIGLLFDSSASMRDKVKQSAEAAAAFLKTANAEDEFFLIEFDESPRLEVPFTADTDRLYRVISRTRPFGRTALFDAIHLGLDAMKQARHDRRALLILSDGGDNRSRRSFEDIRNDVIESEVQIYAMGVFESGRNPGSREEAEGAELLSRLADLTGGRHFPVAAPELPKISAMIADLLRGQYLLGYSPSNDARDGAYRSIRLEVDAPGDGAVLLRHRKGYYAPNY